MLILGGIVLLVVDRLPLAPRHHDAERFPLWMAFGIGVVQCLAMIPGVSRSGATIVGALAFGADKRAAAEFSFFLSMPTMAAAFGYDLFKNRGILDWSAVGQIAVASRPPSWRPSSWSTGCSAMSAGMATRCSAGGKSPSARRFWQP